MIRPDWTPQKAIIAQVKKEDNAWWGSEKCPEFKVVPPLPIQSKWKKAPVVAFIRSMIP